jgi:hypothetical protein
MMRAAMDRGDLEIIEQNSLERRRAGTAGGTGLLARA